MTNSQHPPRRIDRDTLLGIVEQLATRIDFAVLIKQGILKKVGSWYEVLNREGLPDHAWKQATEAWFGEADRPLRLKFGRFSTRAAKLRKGLLQPNG